jgi:hypothetical protein
MTLRTRLFVTGALVAVPLAVGYFFLDTRMRLGAKEDELRVSVAYDLANGLRDRCEADPPRTGRPGRGGDPQPGPARGTGERAGTPRESTPGPAGGPGDRPRRDAAPRSVGQPRSGAYQYFAYDPLGHPSADDAPPLPAERDGLTAATYWTIAGAGV